MSTYFPEKKKIDYYRGTTFRFVDDFFQNGLPVDLRKTGGSTFEAHIRIDPDQKDPLVIIPNQHFQIGAKKYTTEYIKEGVKEIAEDDDVFNILSIECPSSVMAGIKTEGDYFMDIFQYFTYQYGNETRQIEHCLRYYDLFAKTNITKK